MAEINQFNGQPVVNYMARDYDSFLRSMRSQIPDKLPEWTEYESEADFGNVLLQLFAHMGDILSYYQDRVANESFLGTAQSRRSVIHHLGLIGYRLATAAPATAALRLKLPATCNEVITIRRGDAFATRSAPDDPSIRFEYANEVPLVVDCSQLAPQPDPDAADPGAVPQVKIIADIPIEEGRLIQNDFIGTSDGRANQSFKLPHPQLILRASGGNQRINRDIIVFTDLGGTITEWTQVESLAFSRAGQADFTVDIDENDIATIRFGDGNFGEIPAASASIRATYRVGGGTKGNVAAGSIQTIADAPQLNILGGAVTNEAPATGGAARESIDHAVFHAPNVFRSLKRAVTQSDYEALALEFSGVGKVRAVPSSWNEVKLYVAPQGGGLTTDTFKASLLAYFEDLRPITTTIEIIDVEYVEVFVTADISVVSYYNQDEVREQVRDAAGQLLSFENVDFNQPIYLSKFYEAIEAIEGVEFVNITEFRRSNPPVSTGTGLTSGRIAIEAFELAVGAVAYDGLITVNATGGF